VFDTTPESSTTKGPSPDLRRLSVAEPLLRLRGRNSTKADVVRYRLDGVDVAVKDYGRRAFVMRHSIGRLLTRREEAAYRAARGEPGLPDFFGRVGPFSLAFRWVEGRTLADLRGTALDASLFDRLEGIVERLHGLGVALGDLHHRDVLVGEGGTVHVVDLATALVLGERPSRLRRALFAHLATRDRVSLARLRARYTGRDDEKAVAEVGGAAAAWHARGRRLRRLWDRLRGRRAGSRS
jgi:hypothetical protein